MIETGAPPPQQQELEERKQMTDPLPLQYPEQPNPPPRPSRNDPAIRRAAVELILPEVIEWLGGSNNPDPVVENLLTVVTEYDGYRAARTLERRYGWDPDEELVDILGGMAGVLSIAEDAAVKLWAEANGIKPKLPVGTAVKTRHCTGTIIRVDETTARYVVETAEHREQYGTGNGGVLIPYEDCSPAVMEAA